MYLTMIQADELLDVSSVQTDEPTFWLAMILMLLMVVIAGAFGGFLGGIGSTEIKAIRLPAKRALGESPSQVLVLGWVADVLLGAGAAIAGLFIAENLKLNIEVETMSVTDGGRLCAYSLILGFAGRKVLTQFADSLSKRIDKIDQDIDQKTGQLQGQIDVQRLMKMGDTAADRQDWAGACNQYKKAYTLSPDDAEVLHGLGLYLAWDASNRNDKKALREAVKHLSKSIELDDENANVYYDRASTMNYYNDLIAIDGEDRFYPIEDIFADLEECAGAIPIDLVRSDDDLESLFGSPEFERLFPPSDEEDED